MSKFISCGHDLIVNRDEVASIKWNRTTAWRGGDSSIVITLNSGAQHQVTHNPHMMDGVDCYKIEKALLDA